MLDFIVDYLKGLNNYSGKGLAIDDEFIRFVNYFIKTAKNPIGYTFMKRASFDDLDFVKSINKPESVSIVIENNDVDFSHICYRNGISRNAKSILINIEFVKVDIFGAFRDYKNLKYGNIDLDNIDDESKLIIFRGDKLNTFIINSVIEQK